MPPILLTHGRRERLKLEAAIEYADEAVGAWRAHVATPDSASASRVMAAAENLLHFLMREFPADISLGEAQKTMLEQGEKLQRAYLESLRPAAVPLAIMRELLSNHGVLFDVHETPSWAVFARRYGEFIMIVDAARTAAESRTR